MSVIGGLSRCRTNLGNRYSCFGRISCETLRPQSSRGFPFGDSSDVEPAEALPFVRVFPVLERYFQFYQVCVYLRNRRLGDLSRPDESLVQSQMRIVKRNDIPVQARHKNNGEHEKHTKGYLYDAQYIVTPLKAEDTTGNLDRAKNAPTY